MDINERGRIKLLITRFLAYFFVIFTCLLCVLFFAILIINATKTNFQLQNKFSIIPGSNFFVNFVNAWTDASIDIPRGMLNSLLVATTASLLTTYFSALTAYGIFAYDFKFKKLIFTFILGVMMIPTQVVFIPVYVMIARLGWVNTFAGMALPGIVSAHRIFMLRNNFMSVDQSYLDAGRVDGLGVIGTIRHVLMPMCRASVITTSLTAFINGWNNYFWPKILAKDDAHRLISVGIQRLKAQFDSMTGGLSINGSGFYNTVMAGVIISIVPVVIVFAFCQKYILKGFAKNAMK